MGRYRNVIVAAVVLVVGAVAVWLVTGDEPDEPSGLVDTSIPLSELDTTTMPIARASFCDDLAESVVRRALAVPDDVEPKTRAYANGERTKLGADVTDVAHEFGCQWKAKKSIARAWVFAPPVPPKQADTLIRSATKGEGCQRLGDAPAYGSPSLALRCPTERGEEISFRGLFGESWLTCTLVRRAAGGEEGDDAELIDEAGRWCAAVAQAAQG